MRYIKPPDNPNGTKKELPYSTITGLYLSNKIYNDYKDIARKKNMTLSTVFILALKYAINHIEQDPTIIDFPVVLPDEFVEGHFMNEAVILHDYLDKFDNGIGIHKLLHLREDIGLSHEMMLMAYQQLKIDKMIILIPKPAHMLNLPDDYFFIKRADKPAYKPRNTPYNKDPSPHTVKPRMSRRRRY